MGIMANTYEIRGYSLNCPGDELLRVINFRLSKPHFAGQFSVIKTNMAIDCI